MKKNNNKSENSAELRKKAEALLEKKMPEAILLFSTKLQKPRQVSENGRSSR